MWRLCIEKPFLNVQKIFPTKQRDVAKIIDSVKADRNIKRVMIFGSSVTSACNPWSDIDVYYEKEQNLKYPVVICESGLDKWSNFDADDNLMREISRTGVVVYERDAS